MDTKNLTFYPVATPREEELPMIHNRHTRYYTKICASSESVVGVENKWLSDLFREYLDTRYQYSRFYYCIQKVSNHGTCYDKDVMVSDYMPMISLACKEEYLMRGIPNKGDLRSYMKLRAHMKVMIMTLSFIRDERAIDFWEEEYYKNIFTEERLLEYNKEHPDLLAKYILLKEEYDSVCKKFIDDFEEALTSPNESLIFKFNSNHARMYMLIKPEKIKDMIWDYEAYCKTLYYVKHRFKDLLTSRFNKEIEHVKRLSTTSSDADYKCLTDILINRYETKTGKDSEAKVYNPYPYLEFIQSGLVNEYVIPKNMKFIRDTMDIQVIKEFAKKVDKYWAKRMIWEYDEKYWIPINRFERILNLTNIRRVKGIIAPYEGDRPEDFEYFVFK